MSKLRGQLLLYLLWLASAIISLVLIEFVLAAFWINPYLLSTKHAAYTRFHPPGLLAYAAIRDQLYPGHHRVRIYVDRDMAIARGSEKAEASPISIGGSTTETALVPEGQRWPDLLSPPSQNYGVSGNTLIDGYHNLKFLLEEVGQKPGYVYVMFGINDLRAFLTKGSNSFSIQEWHQPRDNILSNIDHVNEELLPGVRVRDSALLSFLRYQTNNFIGREFFTSYSAQKKAQDALLFLTDSEADDLFTNLRTRYLPKRSKVIEAYSMLAAKHDLPLYFIGQPHAYVEDYKPYRADLRLMPVIGNKKMTIAQAARFLSAINEHTRKASQGLGHSYIGVDRCFAANGIDGLFYDSVHYTLKGSQRFATCVNLHLEPEGTVSSRAGQW
jgi:hypothetical protein